PIGAKLNSSDFQKGGFTNEESAQVARWLCDEGLDLLEISGGTYEQMALFGRLGEEKKAESTRRREAYFLDYARNIREAAKDVPLMVTGGFRTASLMRSVVESGEIDVVGLGRPFCVAPDLPNQLFSGTLSELPAPEKDRSLGPGVFGPLSPIRSMRTLNGQAEVAWFYRQIIALSEGREPDYGIGTWGAMMAHFSGEFSVARRRTFKQPSAALPAPDEKRVDA
ncbi:MAG: NADH:flavin oxidoreductase, partial [Myxococcota bacterium]